MSGHTLVFSFHKSTSSDIVSKQKTQRLKQAPAEGIVSMFRLYLENIFASGSMITLHQCWNRELLFNIVCAAFLKKEKKKKDLKAHSIDLNINVFGHPFHIALTYLWGSGLHIMLVLVIETGYLIGDWLLLLNSLPEPRGKLQVCLNLQQLAAVPLESCRK